ncbi:Hypothetical predicted protein, partial [Marmota monax]
AVAEGAGTARLTAAALRRRALVAASWEAEAAAAAAARPVRSPSSVAAGAHRPSPLAAGGGGGSCSHGLLRSLLPPPALCGGWPGSRALRLRAAPPARRAPPPARPRSLTIARWVVPVPAAVPGRETQASPDLHSRLGRLWRRVPRRHQYAHCDTRHSDTRALAHCPNTKSRTRSHPRSPAGTTWERM